MKIRINGNNYNNNGSSINNNNNAATKYPFEYLIRYFGGWNEAVLARTCPHKLFRPIFHPKIEKRGTYCITLCSKDMPFWLNVVLLCHYAERRYP
jgi:hypothetical protein